MTLTRVGAARAPRLADPYFRDTTDAQLQDAWRANEAGARPPARVRQVPYCKCLCWFGDDHAEAARSGRCPCTTFSPVGYGERPMTTGTGATTEPAHEKGGTDVLDRSVNTGE